MLGAWRWFRLLACDKQASTRNDSAKIQAIIVTAGRAQSPPTAAPRWNYNTSPLVRECVRTEAGGRTVGLRTRDTLVSRYGSYSPPSTYGCRARRIRMLDMPTKLIGLPIGPQKPNGPTHKGGIPGHRTGLRLTSAHPSLSLEPRAAATDQTYAVERRQAPADAACQAMAETHTSKVATRAASGDGRLTHIHTIERRWAPADAACRMAEAHVAYM